MLAPLALALAACAAAEPAVQQEHGPASLEAIGQASGKTAGQLGFAEAQTILRNRSDALQAQKSEAEYRRQTAISDKDLSHPKISFISSMIWGRKEIDLGNLDLGDRISAAADKFPALSNYLDSLGAAARKELTSQSIPLRHTFDLDGPRVALAGTWVLFAGGRIDAKQRASEAAAREASDDYAHKAIQLDAELARKYFMLQLARSVTGLREEALEDEERELRRARGFENAGTISRLERMSVEVNRDKAKRELIMAKTDERVAEASLLRLLRLESVSGLSTPLFVLPNGIGSLKEWQDRALASSPVLAAYGAKREQAEQLVRAAKGAFLPTVSTFGQKNLVKHYLTVMEPNWIAGVSLNLTLFDNKNRRADLSAARAKLAEATSGRLEVENQLKTGVETAWLRTNEYRDQYQLTSSTVRLAEENLRMRESAFANGLSTANEVWDARTKLTGAQIEQKVAAYRFVVAWSELNAATGSMKPFIDSLSEPGRITVR